MHKIGYALMVMIGISGAGCMLGEESTEAPLGYEAFKAKYIREVPETAGFVYDDDQLLSSEDQIQQLYAAYRSSKLGGETLSESVVNLTLYGADVWPVASRQNLSYCVSNAFGARKAQVVQAMAAATGAW